MSIEIESVDSLWEKASKRFAQRTEKNLDLRPPRTFDQVRLEIEKVSSEAPWEIQTASQQAKEAGLKVLQFLKLVGGVAAEGASQVFGSANLCFNAVSLLLDIPSKIKEFHEVINGIFTQVHGTLTQFKIYQRLDQKVRGLDVELIQALTQVLISFVDVCALAIGLQSGGKLRHSWRNAKYILFNDDSGIKQALDQFKENSNGLGNVERSLTYEHTKMNGESLKMLHVDITEGNRAAGELAGQIHEFAGAFTESETSRKLKEDKKESLELIVERLNIRDAIEKQADPTKMWMESVAGTGDWLWKRSEYVNWANSNSNSPLALLLTGAENCGKSHMIATIHNELRTSKLNAAARSSPVKIAYHSIPIHAQEDSRSSAPAELALKMLIYQIADASDDHRAVLVSKFKTGDLRNKKDYSCGELWQDLILKCQRLGDTYFLLLDGIDSLPEQSLKEFTRLFAHPQPSSDVTSANKVRVLLGGKDTAFGLQWNQHSKIEIWDSNRSDVEAFIKKHFQNRQFLDGKDDVSKRLAENVYHRLPEKAKGDYAKIQRALGQIDNIIDRTGTPEDIDEVIDDAGQTAKEMAAKDLAALEKQLNTREVEEVNELLSWIHGSPGLSPIDALEAVLYLRFGPLPYKKPLQTKIEGKYSRIMYIDDEGYVRVHPSMLDLVSTSKRTLQVNDDTPQISITINITKADITTIQSFLWKLTEKATFDQFQFANVTSVQSKQNKIQINRAESLTHVLLQSFDLLLHDIDEKSVDLIYYVIRYLPTNLKELYELCETEDISEKDKEQIIRGIAYVLSEEVYVETFWNNTKEAITIWTDVKPFWHWLQNSKSSQYLEMKQKRWLAGVRQEDNTTLALLKPIVTLLSVNLLQDDKWDALELWFCLQWFYKAVKRNSLANENFEKSLDNATDDESVSLSCDELLNDAEMAQFVENVMEWAKSFVPRFERNVLFLARTGKIYTLFNAYDRAVAYCEEGIALDDTQHQCFQTLSLVLRCQAEKLPLSEQELKLRSSVQAAMQVVTLLRPKRDDPKLRTVLIDTLLDLIRLQARLQSPGLAQELCNEVIEIDPGNELARLRLLKSLLDSECFERVQQLLLRCGTELISDSKLTKLTVLLKRLLEEEDEQYLWLLIEATRGSPVLNLVFETFQGIRQSESSPRQKAEILLYEGKMLYHCNRPGRDDREEALALWQQCCDMEDAELYHCRDAIEQICMHHFRQIDESSTPALHVKKLRQIADGSLNRKVEIENRQRLLISYLVKSEAGEEAKQALKREMYDAFEYLSDDELWNDFFGYSDLGGVFSRLNDDANMLTAYSMLGPMDLGYWLDLPGFRDRNHPGRRLLNTVRSQMHAEQDVKDLLTRMIEVGQTHIHDAKALETVTATLREELDTSDETRLCTKLSELPREKPVGKIIWSCDGTCGLFWSYVDDLYICRHCYSRMFCPPCLAKLQNSELRCWRCASSHEWAYLPKWDDKNFADLQNGLVWVGGTISENSIRTGGKQVKVDDWVNDLKQEWGYHKDATKGSTA